MYRDEDRYQIYRDRDTRFIDIQIDSDIDRLFSSAIKRMIKSLLTGRQIEYARCIDRQIDRYQKYLQKINMEMVNYLSANL